jgi:hypothetical protein
MGVLRLRLAVSRFPGAFPANFGGNEGKIKNSVHPIFEGICRHHNYQPNKDKGKLQKVDGNAKE